ncbi:hypothetical protein K505DRAFT_82780 [Melanomma pulvis-pyrius CBS 109.77]|uniref:Uncharacterized protein n=1 Tax=Melanomma pulvis-pyrius CBS 109.77 TaxID=1314802 RepID=A0A6A6XRZ5_9PLEO|nr:hypothetical protein K505DRAFT_82780 [Melanomma pulvis-pyrius CBS 109.77]
MTSLGLIDGTGLLTWISLLLQQDHVGSTNYPRHLHWRANDPIGAGHVQYKTTYAHSPRTHPKNSCHHISPLHPLISSSLLAPSTSLFFSFQIYGWVSSGRFGKAFTGAALRKGRKLKWLGLAGRLEGVWAFIVEINH